MDEFLEKELIDILKSINLNLRDVKNELCEIKLVIREMGEVVDEEEEDEKGNFKGEDVGEEEDEEDKSGEKEDEEKDVEINL